MTKHERELLALAGTREYLSPSQFVIRHLGFFRASSFVIRHSAVIHHSAVIRHSAVIHRRWPLSGVHAVCQRGG
jgi:hypothetical protein